VIAKVPGVFIRLAFGAGIVYPKLDCDFVAEGEQVVHHRFVASLQFRKLLAEFAAQARLPAIYAQSQYVDAGGLMSYGPNYEALYRRAAQYVDKILKGAKPADLPVEQPTKFEMVINLRTAQALGLAIPQALLLSADKVIE